MLCNDFKVLRQSWIDGDLSGEMSARCAGHLGVCPSCELYHRRLIALEMALTLEGEERVDPPPFLAARIMARLEDARPHPLAWLRGFFAPARLAVAAAVALAFAAGLFIRDFAPTAEPPATVATANKIVLEFDASEGERVGLVGDFNNWGKKKVEIDARRADGRWIFELSLAPGRYQYAFEVNGKKWLPDPRAKGIIPDGFGGINSVLYVPTQEGLQIM